MTYDLGPILEKYGVEYNPDRGGNQKVLCPFHEDTVPSASVNLDEGLFNCFTCQIAGDAITLIMHEEGLEFREAKRVTEALAGKDRPAVSRGSDTGGSFLPRRSGHRRGGGGWVSPWARKRP